MAPFELPAATSATTRRALRLSVPEAAAWALMVGLGETYFIADAVRLGASRLELGLVAALPLAVGALGPALALFVLGRARSRKPLVVAAAVAQMLLLGALAIGRLGGGPGVSGVIAAACIYHACGQAAGTAWASWYGELVPAEVRGRWFAMRNRAVHAATCLGLVGGGLLLHLIEPTHPGGAGAAGGQGFALLYGLAAVARLVSIALLALSPEPRFGGLPPLAKLRHAFSGRRGQRSLRQVALVGGLMVAVWIGSPYFCPYMLQELEFTYLEYMAATVILVLAKVLLLPRWGDAVDRHGARSVLLLTTCLIAVIPVPWLWTRGLLGVLLVQTLSGSTWAGYEVSQLALLVQTTSRRTRAHAFALQGAVNGFAQLTGALLGAALVARIGDVRALFATSAAARVLVGLGLPFLLPRLAGEGDMGRRELVLRVLGLRPTGVVHQVVDARATEARSSADE